MNYFRYDSLPLLGEPFRWPSASDIMIAVGIVTVGPVAFVVICAVFLMVA